MKCNVGKTDKIFRLTLALLIAAAGIMFKSWLGFLAIIPLLTAVISFCPIYKLLGINTCTRENVQ